MTEPGDIPEEDLPPRVRAAEQRRRDRELLERIIPSPEQALVDAEDPEFIAQVFAIAEQIDRDLAEEARAEKARRKAHHEEPE